MNSVFKIAAAGLFWLVAVCHGSSIYIESGGQVVGEAEVFTSRTASVNDAWTIKPLENSGTSISDGGPIIANARNGSYVQSLADNLTGSSPNVPPEITYKMVISTPGIYQLYPRWDGNNTNGTTQGQSDSMFADIVELKDGPGGTIADWYEFTNGVNGDFASPAWDGGAGFEQDQANAANGAGTWNIAAPGTYTLRFTQREDGSAIDAWVFQLESLGFPPANPAMSATVPEPTTFALALALFAGIFAVRRRTRATE